MLQVRHTRRENGPQVRGQFLTLCDVEALGDHFEDNHADAFNSVFALPALQGKSSSGVSLVGCCKITIIN